MRLVDRGYTVYKLARITRNGITPTVRTAADYGFGAVSWAAERNARLQ
jgi:hypothetical protein